jgi:hypothetical protein
MKILRVFGLALFVGLVAQAAESPWVEATVIDIQVGQSPAPITFGQRDGRIYPEYRYTFRLANGNEIVARLLMSDIFKRPLSVSVNDVVSVSGKSSWLGEVINVRVLGQKRPQKLEFLLTRKP